MGARICKFVVIAFGVFYVAALFLLAVGTFGLFGAERDPLSGVFLIPLGLPWNRLLGGLSEALLPWVGVLSPAVNLAILIAICRAVRQGN